jgi:ubiquitin carboxyl-terminal hydrolase 9/24
LQEVVPKFLNELTDEELKKESKNEAKNDALSSIIKGLKQLVNRLPNQEDTIKSLEGFRLKMILRWVTVKSLNYIAGTCKLSFYYTLHYCQGR